MKMNEIDLNKGKVEQSVTIVQSMGAGQMCV
jgi:hypothetical protein